MTQGLADYQATGAQLSRSYFLALLAAAYRDAGQAQTGLGALTDALATVDRTGERFYEAELHRLKGELILDHSGSETHESADQQQAQACFQKAIAIAGDQGAKSLELRATMSLARLWRTQGKTAVVEQKLTEIYRFFTEGLDTADLRQAKALLDAPT